MGAAGVAATYPQPGSTYPARAATVPARRGLAGLSCRPAPPAPRGPRLPLAAGSRDASDSANQRGEARFGNFFPSRPRQGRAKPWGAGRGGAAGGADHWPGRRACVERACWRLGPRRATHSGTLARRSFTLVAFVCSCSCARIDKGAIGRRNPGIRNS